MKKLKISDKEKLKKIKYYIDKSQEKIMFGE